MLDQSAGDSRPLHLAAGQLLRLVRQAMAQADALQHLGREPPQLPAVAPPAPDECEIIAGARTFSSVLSSGNK